jgi:hypothetical protein
MQQASSSLSARAVAALCTKWYIRAQAKNLKPSFGEKGSPLAMGDEPDSRPVGPLAPGFALIPPKAEFAYEALVDLGPTVGLGRSPLGERRLIPILGGQFAGPRLRGTVLPGGADRQLLGDDGVRRLDALYEMRVEDGTVVTVRNRALIHDPEGLPRYAFSTLQIVAPAGPHEWLNQRVFVGTLQGLAPEPRVLIRVFALA